MTEIRGMDKLLKKLNSLENPSKPVAKGMRNYMAFLKGKVKPYPPATQANRRPGLNGYSWYVRNSGTRTVTGKSYNNSQQLSKKWSFTTKPMSGSVESKIENFATYAIYVQGERQRYYHANRGWRRVDKTVEASMQVAVKMIGDEIERELNR